MFDLSPVLESAKDKSIAVAFQDLETDAEFFLLADQPFHPASTFKVHVMMEVFRQANESLFSLEDQLPIINSFRSAADGSRFSLDGNDDDEQSLYPQIGELESIRELTRLMIVWSSNLATNILLDKIGVKSVDQLIRSLGIEGIKIQRGIYDYAAMRLELNNRATARGLTQTMNLIARKKVVSEQASEEMIDLLLGQEFNESIPALLPNTVRVAHKTGWTDDVHHDTGIVFPERSRPYILSIMTKGFTEDRMSEAHECMASLSRLIYEQLPI